MAVRTALFADSDRAFSRKLGMLAQRSGIIAETCVTAEDARRALVASSPSMFFANVKLGPIRGVELVHLARLANPRTRAVLYGGLGDVLLAREAQRAGAFFEPSTFLPYSLEHYFSPTLPARDRRDVARVDRRQTFRGGRRATDVEALYVAHHARA